MQGYRGSRKLKKVGQIIDWTPDLLEEYIKCKEDPIYFGENYFKVVDQEGEFRTIDLFDYQKEIIRSVTTNPSTIAELARQAGKALPLDTRIPTPNGWKNMENIHPGDYVFDENGKPTKVLFESEIFTNRKCYKITFDDGSVVRSDAEHLWSVEKSSSKNKNIFKKTTQELFDSSPVYKDSRGKFCSRWKIPTTKPVQYTKKNVTIDPYTLGLWLGDGESASGRLTCHMNDLSFYKSEIDNEFSHNHLGESHIYTGTLYELSPHLRNYRLLKNKHIPLDYLQNDIDTRIKLLQGLMDSDGWVETKKNGSVNCIAFSYNRYPKLIEDMHDLLLGLGIKVFRKNYPKTDSIRLYFHCPKEQFEIFRLPRKLEKQQEKYNRNYYTQYRHIRKIEEIDSVPTKCIGVDSPSHLFLCSKYYIPTHNSTALTVAICWYIIFNQNRTVAILANKEKTAMELLSRIKRAYEDLPDWLQQGVTEWNKGSIILENNSRIIAAATSNDNIRGFAIDFLFVDEAAHIEGWHDFWTSLAPTVSSKKHGRICLVSTVNGLNHFYALTQGARKKTNNYNLISATWRDVPGRDEAWREKALSDLNGDEERFQQEYENRYLGSSGTLIAGWKLQELTADTPIYSDLGIKLYEEPKKDHLYCIVADVSRGKGLDYSAFQCIDVTQMPYRQVLSFRDNEMSPSEFSEVINRFGRKYNHASVMVEINDIGESVGQMLFDDYEYENLLFTKTNGKGGRLITQQFGKGIDMGIRTTKSVKAIGCSVLKLLIEQDQLLVIDEPTINELYTFSRKGTSFEAEEGHNDDTVACLFLFAWLSSQPFFKLLTDINTVYALREGTSEELQESVSPFGFIVKNGQVEPDHEMVDMGDSEVWTIAEKYDYPDNF